MQKRFDYSKHFKFQPIVHLDAAENFFLQRELKYMIPTIFEYNYSRINARNLFPIDRSANPGAETITYAQTTGVGAAAVVSDYASDLEVVNVHTEEFDTKVRSLAVEAHWSIQEIRASMLAGRPLNARLAIEAREAMLRTENSIAFLGDANYGLNGIVADANIPVDPSAGVWSAASAATILGELNDLCNAIPENTGDVEAPTDLLLPVEQYNLIATTDAGVGTGQTILRFFVANSPYITDMSRVHRADELNGAGAGSADLAFAYNNDPMKLRLNVPLDLEQFAPQPFNLAVKVPYHMRTGGMTVHKPLSCRFLSGI